MSNRDGRYADVAATLDTPSFDAQLRAAAAGDDVAFADLVEPFLPALRGYLRGFGAVDVDEIVNDVLLSVHRNLAKFTGAEGSFRSWVFSIAHNRAVDYYRKRRREPIATGDPRTLERPAPNGAEPEQVLADQVLEQRLLDVLNRLPAAQRQVLLLRTVADLSVEQTAAAMGRSVGAVKVLQHRAVKHLRGEIEEPS